MKLLLILVGFFACMSVERVGFRKWSFVFRPGILFLLVMVALVCAGCSQQDSPKVKGDPEVEREFLFACLKNLPAYPGKNASQLCSDKAWIYSFEKANYGNKPSGKTAP